jgi:hypothetical protein
MGKIELDHTGSGGGITLSSDGTNLLLGGTAIGGGGGADLYAANESSPSAQPSATGTNAIAIGDSSTASGSASFAIGSWSTSSGGDSLAMLAATASGFRSIAIGQGAMANSTCASAFGQGSSSNGARAMAQGALALGGARAGGTDSFAAAIANNTGGYGAIGTGSVAIGYQNKATGTYSFAAGEEGADASGYGSVAIGRLCTASGDRGVAIGQSSTAGSAVNSRTNVAMGTSCNASGGSAFAFGERADTRGLYGKYAFGSGYGGGTGAAQTGVMVLGADTTDATATALCVNFGSFTPNSTNQVILPNNSVYGFTGTVIARENSAQTNDFAVWEIKGGAVRAATASTTTLGSYNINNWSIALSADTTNGAVAITVTGEALHSIRWVATVNTTEVIY